VTRRGGPRRKNNHEEKNKMKKLFATLGCLLLLGSAAQAQQYGSTQLGTNMAYAANTTNTINGGTFNATKANDIGLRLKITSVGTDTTACTLTIMKSLDGTYWDAAPFTTVSLPTIANASAYLATNLSLNAIGYIRMGTFINPGTNVISVLGVHGYIKPVRQGN
jgi:hypothetical protein